MASLAERQRVLVDDLLLIEDPQSRLEELTRRAARVALPAEAKRPENLVEGCVSQVWLTARLEHGLCHFQADADSVLVKGLAVFLCQAYSGVPPQEIVDSSEGFLAPMRWERQLSPTRLNGLGQVLARIKALARASLP